MLNGNVSMNVQTCPSFFNDFFSEQRLLRIQRVLYRFILPKCGFFWFKSLEDRSLVQFHSMDLKIFFLNFDKIEGEAASLCSH